MHRFVVVPLLALLGCGDPVVDAFTAGDVSVHAIRGPSWNAYVLEGDEGVALFDSGAEADEAVLLRGLEIAGFAPSSLDAVVASHGHFDHAGNFARLRADGAGRVVVHEGDADLLRAGDSGPAPITAPEGHLVKLVADMTYTGLEPDVIEDGAFTLDDFGVRVDVQPVPGHTPGSVAAVLGDGHVLVGDLFRTDGDRAVTHVFSVDLEADRRSVRRLLDAGATTLHVAHGPAVDAAAAEEWLAERPLEAPDDFACGDHC
jgi:glyoxylase-like metal-dependent hydrolase (beta-lactamase superfamily II)